MIDSHNSMQICRRLVRSPLSLILSALVLVSRECSAFLPTQATARSCWPPPFGEHMCIDAGMKRSASTTVGASLLFGTAASDGSTAISSSYAQKFLAELEASGRVMTKRDQKWWARFEELEEYKREFGDCNVPQRYGGNPQLGNWVFIQRQNYKKNNLSSERIEALESIGFEWTNKEIHGDTLLSRGSQLRRWVAEQRSQYRLLQKKKHSNLTDERIEKLNQIGFVWDAQEASWEESFAELVEFKTAHGHTDVPKSWEDQQLSWWVSVQRSKYRKLKQGKMTGITEERIQRLEDLGFEWRSKKTYKWKIRLGELRDFYNENGVVPIPRAEHPTLFNWAKTQKKEYDKFVRGGKTSMDEDRLKDLERIGFFEVFGN